MDKKPGKFPEESKNSALLVCAGWTNEQSESDWREGGAHEREASREEDLIMDREG